MARRYARAWYLIAVAFAAIAIGIHVYQWYFSRPLWVDEEMLLLNVRDRALGELTGQLWLNQTAPLGWLGIQHLMIDALGTHDRVVRALPVALGIGTILAALWAGIRWMGPAGAAVFVLACGLGQWTSYYIHEAKPYSADLFVALILPALAIWALEDGKVRRTPTVRLKPDTTYEAAYGNAAYGMRRIFIWWAVATFAHFLAYSGLYIIPACAAVIYVVTLKRHGSRHAFFATVPALAWVATVAVQYTLSIRFARENPFLQEFWRFAFPDAEAGLGEIFSWLGSQAAPIASHPGGAEKWMFFWLTVVSGIVIAWRSHPAAGAVLAAVPLSACLLASLGMVPMADRLALWMIPASYAAIAVTADFGVRNFRAIGLAALALCVVNGSDMLRRAHDNFRLRPLSNHGLDDASATRFLMQQRRPGDVLLTTHFGLPGIWWYAGIDVAEPNVGRVHPADGGALFEVRHVARAPGTCETEEQTGELRAAMKGASRVAVYLGFGSMPPVGFPEMVLDELSRLGALISFRRIAEEGMVAVFDLRLPPKDWAVVVSSPRGEELAAVPRPGGCLGVKAAERW